MHLIDMFVQNNKVGTPVIISAGSINTLHQIDKYTKQKGYDSVIVGNSFVLALINADKVIIVWDGIDKKLEKVLSMCKREGKPYTEIVF